MLATVSLLGWSRSSVQSGLLVSVICSVAQLNNNSYTLWKTRDMFHLLPRLASWTLAQHLIKFFTCTPAYSCKLFSLPITGHRRNAGTKINPKSKIRIRKYFRSESRLTFDIWGLIVAHKISSFEIVWNCWPPEIFFFPFFYSPQPPMVEWRKTRPAAADRRTTAAQITTLQNCGEEKSISEWTTCQTFRRRDYNGRIPHQVPLLSGKNRYFQWAQTDLPTLDSWRRK